MLIYLNLLTSLPILRLMVSFKMIRLTTLLVLCLQCTSIALAAPSPELNLTSEELAWLKAHPVLRVSRRNRLLLVEKSFRNASIRSSIIWFPWVVSCLLSLGFL